MVFHTLRVRYSETDQMGVAWHGHHVAWFEAARVEWLRANGHSYSQLEQAGFRMPVLRVSCEYRKAVRFDDELAVGARVAEYNGVRVSFEYEIRAVGRAAVVAVGLTEHVFTDQAMRPVRASRALPEVHALLRQA